MSTSHPVISTRFAVAALLGAFYAWMSTNFWGGYAANNLIGDWLLGALAQRGQEASYLAAIYMHDAVVNVLLAAPVAALLVTFRSLNNWPNLLTAVAFGVAVSFWDTNWDSISRLLRSDGFWLGLGMSIWSLPIAFAGIRALKRRHGDSDRPGSEGGLRERGRTGVGLRARGEPMEHADTPARHTWNV